MHGKLKRCRNSLLQKIITVTFLPMIISFWITGWTLTKILKPVKSTEYSPKALRITQNFAPKVKSSETADEDIEITNKPLIAI